MKRVFLLIVILFTMGEAPKAQTVFANGSFNYYIIQNIGSDSGCVSVSAYYNLSGDIVIPSTVYYNGRHYTVTEIHDAGFSRKSNMTSVTIPNSVTYIGQDAFYRCTGLTSVTIGNSVSNIDYTAFSGCTGLTSVTIPNSVTSIGGSAFYGCSSLTSVTIGNSVTSIGGSAFQGCTGLTNVTIPNSVTSIGDGAFYNCTGLTSVIVGNSVTSIGDYAFGNCTSLNDLQMMPRNPPSLGNNVFSNYSMTIWVDCASLSAYQTAWGGLFLNPVILNSLFRFK